MHPLHVAIGDILRHLDIPGAQIVLGQDCGGSEKICLYGEDSNAGDPWIVDVDAAVFVHNEVKVVLEIEESDLRPVYFCGKFLATAISRYYKGQRGRVPLSDSMLFIQVFVKKNEDPNWSKYTQARYLTNEIQHRLPHPQIRIKLYSFHYGTVEEFNTAQHRDELAKEIRDFLTVAVSEITA